MANNRNAFVAAVERLLRQCAAAVPYVRTAFPIGIGNVLLMQLPLCKSVPGNRPRKFSIRRPYRFPAGTYPQYALQAQISAWGRCSPVCTARVRSTCIYSVKLCFTQAHGQTPRLQMPFWRQWLIHAVFFGIKYSIAALWVCPCRIRCNSIVSSKKKRGAKRCFAPTVNVTA